MILSRSTMYLMENTTIDFIDNHADYVGGAIFIDDQYLWESVGRRIFCFYQVVIASRSEIKDIHIEIQSNTANYSGEDIYGGLVDICM